MAQLCYYHGFGDHMQLFHLARQKMQCMTTTLPHLSSKERYAKVPLIQANYSFLF